MNTTPKHPHRRAALKMLGAAMAAGIATPARAAASLNIYSWPNYFSQDSLNAYAKLTGVMPNISNYDSNDTMFAKMNSPAGDDFDMVIPSSSWVPMLHSRNLIQPIDHSRLDLASLDKAFLGQAYDPDNTWSIPKDWGVLGVVYDPEATGGTITTWQDFLDAGAEPNVSGKICLSDSAWETLGIILWLQGKDWNKVSAEDINAAGAQMIDFAKHVSSFAAVDPDALANGTIVLAQANQNAARTAIALNPKLRWVVPGPMSELWVDCYAIPRRAPDLDQTYDFLAYQLRPDVQLQQTIASGFPGALAGLRNKVPPNVPEYDLIFGGKNLDMSKLVTFVVNPETIGVYLQMQTELEAAAE